MLRLLLALPLIFLPNALHFSGAPLVAGLNYTNLLFLVVVVAIPLFSQAGVPRLPGIGRLTPALMLLFFAYVVAFFIGQSRSSATMMEDLTVLKTALFYPMFYFLYRNCRLDLRATRQLLLLSLLVAVLAGVEAIREGIAYNFLDSYSDDGRASGPFGETSGNSNLAGYFYVTFLPVLVSLALFLRGHRGLRIAALVGVGLLAVAILATFSRQAYAIALLCLLLVSLRRNLAVAILIGALMLAATTILPSSVTERVASTTQTNEAGGAELDSSTASRFEIWSGAMQMWREHPAGVGLNRFKAHIGDYTRYANFDAHNYFVLFLAEAGPLALLALLWVFWRAWGIARSILRSAPPGDSEAQALGTGLSLMVIALAMGNTFGSFMLQGLAMGSVWAFFGLAERYGALKAAQTDEQAHEAAMARPRVAAAPRFPLVARARSGRDMHGLGDAP